MSHPLMAASTRVALAAYLHDLGKFAERGRIFEKHPDLPAHLTLYCPFHKEGGWYSHRHAANTALATINIQNHPAASRPLWEQAGTPRTMRTLRAISQWL